MNANHQIFCGIFTSELSQRFLRIACTAVNNAFENVCTNHGSHLKECLLKVSQWDKNIIEEESSKICNEYPDVFDIFKKLYINYVKSMRGNNQVKIMVNVPKFDDFLKSLFIHISNNKFMKDGKYFERGPLDQKCICMECLRDSLYDYLGDEYVRIVPKKNTKTFKPSRGISEEETYHSEEDTIIPDDSVSSIGYHERKKRKDNDSDSLSSVSLSQASKYKMNKKIDNTEDDKSQISRLSEDSNHRAIEKHGNRERGTERGTKTQYDEDSQVSYSVRNNSEAAKFQVLKYRDEKRYRSDDMSEISNSHNEKRRYDKDSVVSSRDNRSQHSRSKPERQTRSQISADDSEITIASDTDGSQLSTNDHVRNRYKRRDDVIKEERYENAMKEDSESSEEEKERAKRQEKQNSPCKSYITKLTEDSRMTCED